MMIIVQIILATIHMCLIPYLIGYLILPGREKAEAPVFALRLAGGLMASYALYEVLALMCGCMGKGLRFVTKAFLLLTVLLAVLGLVLWIRNRKPGAFKPVLPRDPYMIAACVLVIIQIAAILFMATPDKDDAFYSGLSSMSLSYDYLLEYDAYSGQMNEPISARYALSALPLYQASLSLLSAGLHHLFISHNLFPLFYMPLAYALYYCIAKRLFEKEGIEGAQGKFMFCFSLMHMIGNYYVFSPENFLVTRMWQGKALFAALGIPFLWHYAELALSCSSRAVKVKRAETFKYWGRVLCGLLAAAFMGETGLYLGVFMLACQTLAFCIVNKTLRGVIPAVICCLPSGVLLGYLLL